MTPEEKASYLTKKLGKEKALFVIDIILNLMDRFATVSGNYLRGTEKGNYVDAETEENYWKQHK